MAVYVTNERGQRRPLNEDLVYELLGDGNQSDLEMSDEESRPTAEPREIFGPDSLQEEEEGVEEESDSEMNVPLAQVRERVNVQNDIRDQNQARNRRNQQRRPRIWRRSDYTDKLHEYSNTGLSNGEELSPLQYFGLYFNEAVFENAARCTNLYYMRETEHILNTNSQEIRKFFGVLLVMGCIPYPRIHMYWRAATRSEIVANNMSRDRFFQLRANIHVVESDRAPEGDANPLWKVQPVLTAVRNSCLNIERRPGFYSIDEQMIPFTKRCQFRVLIKNKPRPVGLKNYVITTSSGLMIDFAIYYPQNPTFSDTSLGEGPAVILALADNVPPNICIYFDRSAFRNAIAWHRDNNVESRPRLQEVRSPKGYFNETR